VHGGGYRIRPVDLGLERTAAIVCGASSGMGLAISRALAAEGCDVTMVSRDPGKLDAAASSVPGAVASAGDVRDQGTIERAVRATIDRRGRLDILINNAGILGETKPIWETDAADVRRVLDVNLMGTFLCLRAVTRVMRLQESRPHRGHIVNVASIQGKEGMPYSAAYSTSKAAIIGLTKSVAKELAQEQIYVNCITPAAAETPMAKLISAERKADILRRIPMGRLVEVDEVARMIAWLVSADCSFSTGAVFDLSGGRATY
jgi:2-dehydro-3-deoxy-L-rhamnonate dehydrogenase (NAD+)